MKGERAGTGAGETPSGEWRLPKLRVDRNGDWYDDGVQVTHAGVLANLRSNLRRDAQGYFIQTRVRIPVEVEDVPLIVERVQRRGPGLHGWLNDGTDEPVDPRTLRFGPDGAPYCAVKSGAFEGRLSRAAAFQLLALAEHDEATGQSRLRVGGVDVPLGRTE